VFVATAVCKNIEKDFWRLRRCETFFVLFTDHDLVQSFLGWTNQFGNEILELVFRLGFSLPFLGRMPVAV